MTPRQIRAAYYRLFPLLHHDGPEAAAAEPYFARVQRAFETLIDPDRRAEYDLGDRTENPSGCHVFGDESENGIAHEMTRTGVAPPWRVLRNEGGLVISDLAVRFGATRVGRVQPSRDGRRPRCIIKPLDFALGHSVTVGIPALGSLMERRLRAMYRLSMPVVARSGDEIPIAEGGKMPEMPRSAELDFRFRPPTLTVSGSVYQLADELFLTPISLLVDRYQPLLPHTIPRKRVIRLAESKTSPLVAVKLRQEITHRSWTGTDADADTDTRRGVTVVEVERDVLPDPALTTRLSHALFLPCDIARLNRVTKSSKPYIVAIVKSTMRRHRAIASN